MSESGFGSSVRAFARRRAIDKVVRSAVGRLGFDLVGRHYYSAIPDLDSLPETVWSRTSDLGGLSFDPAASLEFARRELAASLAEYRPPRAPTGDPGDFHLDNGFYESVDAEMLYAVVRRFEPRRIVELGSGMSTLVIRDARTRGALRGTRHLVFDPFPRPDLVPAIESSAELRRLPVTEVPIEEFRSLEAGDLLFVDTTHTVKIDSDVNRVVLDILPALNPGVLVHFHDVFLPWEYPREFLVERRFFWAEQYLLQAFLAFNPAFEVLLPLHALSRMFPEEITRLVPSARPDTRPAGFWIRRVTGERWVEASAGASSA